MKRKFLVAGIVVGAILALGPLWGAIATAVGMMGAFKTLAGEGISDPKALSDQIGIQLMSASLGLLACPIGILLLVLCIVGLALDKKPPPLPPAT